MLISVSVWGGQNPTPKRGLVRLAGARRFPYTCVAMARILKFLQGRKMTKNERVAAALKGDHVDAVPVSAWWHDFEREWSASDLAEATLEAYRKYDWDLIKVNPRASYFGEAFGAKYAPREGGQPDLIEPGVSSPEQLRRIERQDGRGGVWAEELEALRLIAARLDDEAPFMQTIFSPLATMSRITGSTKSVQQQANPALGEIATKTAGAVMGGVSQEETLTSGPPQGVSREARGAIEETHGQRFFLAPGCSIDPATPEANLRALVKAAR